MKKLFTAAALMLLSVAAMQAQLNVYLGFSEPILRDRSNGVKTNTVLNGGKIGVGYEYNFWKGMGINAAVQYTIAGNHTSWELENQVYSSTQQRTRNVFQSLDIPVDLHYKFEIAQKTYLSLFTGPTVQVGLSSHKTISIKDALTGVQVDAKINSYEIDKDNDGKRDIHRVNVLWGLGLGLQYDHYFLKVSYNFGIMNSYRDHTFTHAVNQYSMKGRNDEWGVGIGYIF